MFNMFDDFHMGPRANTFSSNYQCYSSSFGALSDNKSDDIKKGGKIIMPPSALDQLSRLNISYPMLFKLTNTQKNNRITHCGVLEFVSEEGVIFLPYWMMQNLLLNEGDLVKVENCTLPIATYARFQPQSTDFHDISNPKAVLENALRNFACLTKGDVIAIHYNNRQYELCVLEVKPSDSVCIIECDLSLEFDAPMDQQTQDATPAKIPDDLVVGTPDMKKAIEEYMKESAGFSAFVGSGNRIDGKKKNLKGKKVDYNLDNIKRGIPNYKWSFGHLTYIRNNDPKSKEILEEDNSFSAFEGTGQTLKKSKRPR